MYYTLPNFHRHAGGRELHEIAVMLFLFITAPVSAHLLAKAALHRRKDGNDKEVVVADE